MDTISVDSPRFGWSEAQVRSEQWQLWEDMGICAK